MPAPALAVDRRLLAPQGPRALLFSGPIAAPQRGISVAPAPSEHPEPWRRRLRGRPEPGHGVVVAAHPKGAVTVVGSSGSLFDATPHLQHRFEAELAAVDRLLQGVAFAAAPTARR